MEKEISFPIDKAIGFDLLRTISVEIFGYCYSAQKGKDSADGVKFYEPKSSSWLVYNSFLPTISAQEVADSDGVYLRISGTL